MKINTKCTRCGAAMHRQARELMKNTPLYCSRACFQEARKDKTDKALAYVTENMGTESMEEIADHLHLTREALAYRLLKWRRAGLLTGHSRTYKLKEPRQENAAFFDWLDYENDVIVGGNLYPDLVTGTNSYFGLTD